MRQGQEYKLNIYPIRRPCNTFILFPKLKFVFAWPCLIYVGYLGVANSEPQTFLNLTKRAARTNSNKFVTSYIFTKLHVSIPLSEIKYRSDISHYSMILSLLSVTIIHIHYLRI